MLLPRLRRSFRAYLLSLAGRFLSARALMALNRAE